MTVETIAPAWMHEQITAEQYETWSEEQCAGIEIVDGMVVVSPALPHGTTAWLESWPMHWTALADPTGTPIRTSTSDLRMCR